MTAPSMQLPYYTIGDVEELLRYSRSTVHRLCKKGDLIKFDLGRNSVRITGDSLRAFISKQMMSSQMSS